MDREKKLASSYAVEVFGLPSTREDGAPNVAEITDHFSKFGKVHSVVLLRDVQDLLEIYQVAQQKLFEAEELKTEIELKKASGQTVSDKEVVRAKTLQDHYKKLIEAAIVLNPSKLQLDKFTIVSAIVIFEKPKSRDVCLFAHEEFAPTFTLACWRKTPAEFLFRGHYHLSVAVPAEPFAINWANMKDNAGTRILFSLLLFLILVILLAINIYMTMTLQKEFESLDYSSYCPKLFLYAKEENVKSELEKTFVRNCFCERVNIMELAFGYQSKYKDKCSDYLSNVHKYYLALPGYGLLIAFFNWILKKLVEFTAIWYRFKDITGEATFQLTLLYAMQLVNMTLPLLMTNFNFSETAWVSSV